MIRHKLMITLVLLALISNQVYCDDGFFTVVGSYLLRLQSSYRASVAYNGYESDKILQVGIKGNDTDFGVYKNVTLSGSGVQIIDFDLKNQPEGDYVMEVKSDNFEGQKKLYVKTKNFLNLIQLDKAVYKPSDLVKFRVLTLDGETKPYNDIKSAEVYITDGADNRIKQFDSVKFIKGVYQSELQLSDSPVLGKWKIHVKINGEETAKEFGVAEYVLPLIEVTINANPDVSFDDGKIQATIKTRYTFGKAAKGNVTVKAFVESVYVPKRSYDSGERVSKTILVDGKSFIEFDIKEELNIHEYTEQRKVVLFVTFTDFDGRQSSARTKVMIHFTPYKIKLKTSANRFKPGMPFKITAAVNNIIHKEPITDKVNPIQFKVTYNYDIITTCTRRIIYKSYDDYDEDSSEENATTTTTTTELPEIEEYPCRHEKTYTLEHEKFIENGIVELDIDTNTNATEIEDIEAKYLSASASEHHIFCTESENDQYIQANVMPQDPSHPDDIEIEVFSTHEINHLLVHIFGIDFINSKTFSFPSTKRYVLTIKETSLMRPAALFVISYITADGEIISDSSYVKISQFLKNQIDIKLTKNQTKPGENVEISISTQPNSLVGLMGVDQSVLLLKKGNDIEKSDVFDEYEKLREVQHDYSDKNEYDDFNIYRGIRIITNAKKEFASEWIKLYSKEYDHYIYKPSTKKKKPKHKFRPTSVQISIDLDSDVVYNKVNTNKNANKDKKVKKPVKVREKFPETWLFETLDFDSNESTKVLNKKVPDTITSWMITGFSVDPLTGLGLTQQPTKLNVFQPFFVTANLPYSIKRGEVVAIPITVFNYLENDQSTQVTLFNKDHEFEFVEVADDAENSLSKSKRALESEKTRTIDLKSNANTLVSFMIRPLKAGLITIKVAAESDVAGDGIQKLLRVEPEGVTQYVNEAVFIDLKNDVKFSKSVELTLPANAVEDSIKVEASVIGDILGPTISNIHKLIKLPYGCGEQNMVNFVPNIIVLDYLTNLNKLTPEIETKAKKYMEIGYQKELTFKHDDGSYSAFGDNDASGSTWLTAFVAKSFNQASKYIHIDDSKITEALDFLAKVQTDNGSFPEVGYVLTRSVKGIGLTAYTLITFLENKIQNDKYKSVIDKALNYIANNLDEIDDIYSLAIATYAMQLASHDKKGDFLEKLNKKAIIENGVKYWKKENVESRYEWLRPNSVNIEITAYALQAFNEASLDGEAIEIMKWLIKQRNKNGGFQSSQDTVVGLQALSKLATRVYSTSSDIKITIKSDDKKVAAIDVNDQNALILQKYELPTDARHFEVEASGKGFSILQISYKYNLDDADKSPRFLLKPTLAENLNKKIFNLNVCTNFVADAEADKSNMAVMEVTLPSGFSLSSNVKKELLSTEKVKKVETKDDDGVVMVYFDDVGTSEICVDFSAYRNHAVAKLKPVPIVIYDYYDNSRHARTFYNPPEISLCDICLNEVDCKSSCKVPAAAHTD